MLNESIGLTEDAFLVASKPGNRIQYCDPETLELMAAKRPPGGYPPHTVSAAGDGPDDLRKAAMYAVILHRLAHKIAPLWSRRNHNSGLTFACLHYWAAGQSCQEIAKRLKMNRKTVHRRATMLQRWVRRTVRSRSLTRARKQVEMCKELLVDDQSACEAMGKFLAAFAAVCAKLARGGRDGAQELALWVDEEVPLPMTRRKSDGDAVKRARTRRQFRARMVRRLGERHQTKFVIAVLRGLASHRKGKR